jgi:hypothetical protein
MGSPDMGSTHGPDSRTSRACEQIARFQASGLQYVCMCLGWRSAAQHSWSLPSRGVAGATSTTTAASSVFKCGFLSMRQSTLSFPMGRTAMPSHGMRISWSTEPEVAGCAVESRSPASGCDPMLKQAGNKKCNPRPSILIQSLLSGPSRSLGCWCSALTLFYAARFMLTTDHIVVCTGAFSALQYSILRTTARWIQCVAFRSKLQSSLEYSSEEMRTPACDLRLLTSLVRQIFQMPHRSTNSCSAQHYQACAALDGVCKAHCEDLWCKVQSICS